MNNFYYLEFNKNIENSINHGDLYLIDTGYGILELGGHDFSLNITHQDVHFSEGLNLKEFLHKYFENDVYELVKIEEV